MEKDWSTLDVYATAWIYLTTGIYPELKYFKGRVSFHFPLAEQVINSISEYNSGEKIEALRYSLTIKNFKSQIFQLKSQNEK